MYALYVNGSAAISERAVEIAASFVPDRYTGHYIFFRDNVPYDSSLSETYTLVLCYDITRTNYGYQFGVVDGNAPTVIRFGFAELSQNAPAGSVGLCTYTYTVDTSDIDSVIYHNNSALVYSSDFGLPHLVTLGGDPYAFALVVLCVIVCVYYLFYSIWHHWIME